MQTVKDLMEVHCNLTISWEVNRKFISILGNKVKVSLLKNNNNNNAVAPFA